MDNNDNTIGRRVNATVKLDLEKTSSGAIVIKTNELLEDIFNPICNILTSKNDKKISNNSYDIGMMEEDAFKIKCDVMETNAMNLKYINV